MGEAFLTLRQQVTAAEEIIDKAAALIGAALGTSDGDVTALAAELKTHIDGYNAALAASSPAPASTPAA